MDSKFVGTDGGGRNSLKPMSFSDPGELNNSISLDGSSQRAEFSPPGSGHTEGCFAHNADGRRLRQYPLKALWKEGHSVSEVDYLTYRNDARS